MPIERIQETARLVANCEGKLATHVWRSASVGNLGGWFILYIDLDHLKKINDALGHKEGDLVLIKTANILKECFRDADVIARIGGDEFVVMLMGSVEYNIKDLTARLQNNLEQYNRRNNHSYELSLSVGVAYYDPKCPCSLDELLGHGDKMMYKKKIRSRS